MFADLTLESYELRESLNDEADLSTDSENLSNSSGSSNNSELDMHELTLSSHGNPSRDSGLALDEVLEIPSVEDLMH